MAEKREFNDERERLLTRKNQDYVFDRILRKGIDLKKYIKKGPGVSLTMKIKHAIVEAFFGAIFIEYGFDFAFELFEVAYIELFL